MHPIVKKIALLAALLALGLLAGTGAQRLRAYYAAEGGAPQPGNYQALIDQSAAPVVLFSSPTCPYCKLAKAFLAEHRVAYRNVDVTTAAGRQLFEQHHGSGVPLLLTARMRLQGFVEPEYRTHVLPWAAAKSAG